MRLKLHTRRSQVLAASASVLAALAAWSAVAGAQGAGGLESKLEAARSEARTLAADLETKTSRLAEAESRAASAAEREAELGGVLAQGERREDALSERVEAARARLAAARERLNSAVRVLKRRLVAIYKGTDPDTMTLILQADGFDDLATRAEYLSRIETADEDLIARVRELRGEVVSELAAVAEARAEQREFNQRYEEARAEIAAARADAEADAAALAGARGAQRRALSGLRARVDRWTRQVAEQQQVSETDARQQVGDWVGDWAIPEAIVMCESGGNFQATNPSSGAGGAYQILPSTWRAHGGKGLPHQAPPAEQHRIAAMIWADSGGSAWVCAG